MKRKPKTTTLRRGAGSSRAAKPRTSAVEPAARILEADSSVVFECDAKAHGAEPILGAAYLMTDRAYVSLAGRRAGTVVVELRSKQPAGRDGLLALAEAFRRERETQQVRWAIAKNNQSIREYIAEQAVLAASGRLLEQTAAPAPAPEADQLSDAQRQEIERLIAEVEGEIKAMNEKKAARDPKNIKASWEEKQEREARP